MGEASSHVREASAAVHAGGMGAGEGEDLACTGEGQGFTGAGEGEELAGQEKAREVVACQAEEGSS